MVILKRIYSSIGRYNEAGNYYYKGKIIHLKQLLNPIFYSKQLAGDSLKKIYLNYKQGKINLGGVTNKILYKLKNILLFFINPINWFKLILNVIKLLFSLIGLLFWGFGEKPNRIIISSGVIITFYSLFYYISINSPTNLNLINSISLSCSVFLTFGFAELINQSLYIPIISEALIGVLCIGFLIAGYVNKKRY